VVSGGPRPRRRVAKRPPTPPNPLRSEADAFAFLLWFVGAVALIAVLVLIVEAL
jgi:hypothetical protein